MIERPSLPRHAPVLRVVAVAFPFLLPMTVLGEGSDNDLQRFVSQYAGISSVRMTAVATVHLAPPSDRVGSIEIEYWSTGNRYRLDSRASPELDVLQDTDVAYDGQHHQLWLRKSNLLSVRQEDYEHSLAAMANPFFLPIAFLSERPFATPTSLDRAVQTLGRMNETRAVAGAGSERLTERTVSPSDGPPFSYRVLSAEQGSLTAPAEVTQLGPDGRAVGGLRLADYETAGRGDLVFPRSLSLRGFDENGVVNSRLEIVVTSLEIDLPIDPNVFLLRGDDKTRYWDSDRDQAVDDSPAAGH